MTGDSITRFAQHYRLEAAAVLVQIAKDESAPPTARAAAAEKILAYSDGRPGPAKQITVADVADMTDEQREDLLNALLRYYDIERPGVLKDLMTQAYLEAMRVLETPALPKPNRYKRGSTPPTPIAQPGECLPVRSSVEAVPQARIAHPARLAHSAHAQATAACEKWASSPVPS